MTGTESKSGTAVGRVSEMQLRMAGICDSSTRIRLAPRRSPAAPPSQRDRIGEHMSDMPECKLRFGDARAEAPEWLLWADAARERVGGVGEELDRILAALSSALAPHRAAGSSPPPGSGSYAGGGDGLAVRGEQGAAACGTRGRAACGSVYGPYTVRIRKKGRGDREQEQRCRRRRAGLRLWTLY